MRRVLAPAQGFGSARGARLAAAGATLILALAVFTAVAANPRPPVPRAPNTLHETGLYSDLDELEVDPKHLAFSPQYPLWTDGAAKRRWISLPPGTAIDATDPERWEFPVGTRFWKEFSFAGARVETRFLERQADGQWLYAAYAWSPDGREAHLTSERGRRSAYSLGGGKSHTIPGVGDCKACHQGARSEVLGFSALQLSSERDPFAPNAEARPAPGVDLRYLVENGLLVNFPKSLLETPPRIVAASPVERAALGYLHANCGHCHNAQGPLQNLGLFLRHVAGADLQPALASTVRHAVKKAAPGQSPAAARRIDPKHPEQSALLERMASRYPALQMPPLGTEVVDAQAVSVLRRWIAEMDPAPEDARIADADSFGTEGSQDERGP